MISSAGDDFMSGMEQTDHNPFTVLNLIDEDDLNILVEDCDIVLGESSKEIEESWNEIKLEETLRAAVAEAQCKVFRDQLLVQSRRLESKNLGLGKIDNGDRGFKSRKGGLLDRERSEVSLMDMMSSEGKETNNDVPQQQKGCELGNKSGDGSQSLSDLGVEVNDKGTDISNHNNGGGMASGIVKGDMVGERKKKEEIIGESETAASIINKVLPMTGEVVNSRTQGGVRQEKGAPDCKENSKD